MSDKLELGTRVKVTRYTSKSDKGTVVARQVDGSYLIYLDNLAGAKGFFRSEFEVYVKPKNQRIIDRRDLVNLRSTLGVSSDWHEPDEVTIEVRGKSFDNAGFWDDDHADRGSAGKDHEELHVAILKDGEQVATVNLATLFAWATGYDQ